MGSHSEKRRPRTIANNTFSVLSHSLLQQESIVPAAAAVTTTKERSTNRPYSRKILLPVVCVLLVLTNAATIASIPYGTSPNKGSHLEYNATSLDTASGGIVSITIDSKLVQLTHNSKRRKTMPRWKDDTFQRTKVHVYNQGKRHTYEKRYGYDSISMH